MEQSENKPTLSCTFGSVFWLLNLSDGFSIVYRFSMGFTASSQRNHKNADLSDGFDSFEYLIFSNFKSNVIEVN